MDLELCLSNLGATLAMEFVVCEFFGLEVSRWCLECSELFLGLFGGLCFYFICDYVMFDAEGDVTGYE